MKKCCDTCIHKKVCDYWEKEAHPNDYGTYDGEPCMDYFPADVVPVVHGKWETDRFGLERSICSVCGAVYEGDGGNYCPNCGADMRGSYRK